MATTDIYKITELVSQIQDKFIDSSDDTLFMGIFGYLNEVHSNQIQNAIVNATEWGNEAFATKAKFEKNILTHAISHNVSDINAIPAKMNVMIGFIEKELLTRLTDNSITIDKYCKFIIGGFEYHLDYDMIITKSSLSNGDYTYNARYSIDIENSLSDVTNPYLPPPLFLNINNDKFIFINCTIRQIEYSEVYKKITSTNILENKTIDFEITDQLADFEVIVTEDGKRNYLTPIFEGQPTNNIEKYCYYTYIDRNNIRVKFDRNSYEPELNSEVNVILKTTKGSSGNFSYKTDIYITLHSDDIDYQNLIVMIKPISNSIDGFDRKSLSQLKQIIPKQILSRGGIINNKDLDNYFNSLDSSGRLKFFKKRDNQIERLYYSYMILKDNINNVIPTNTVDIKIKESEFNNIHDSRLGFAEETLLQYDTDNLCIVNKDNLSSDQILELESSKFMYAVPLTCIINKSPLSVSYYLNNINTNYYLNFSYINQNSEIQFISTSVNFKRMGLDDSDYILSMDVQQNINTNKYLVTLDSNNNIIDSDIKPILYLDNDKQKYYVEGTVTSIDTNTYKYTIEFRLKTNSIIDKNNKIQISDIFQIGTQANTYAYMDSSIPMSIYLFSKFDLEYGRNNADSLFSNLSGYTLCNKYDIEGGVNLFYNYSGTVKSTVTVSVENDENIYTIKQVPVVRYTYMNDVDRFQYLLDYIHYKKIYIDSALEVLENSFDVDLKFYNTYGKSRIFTIGHDGELLDKTNLTLNFKIKLTTSANVYNIKSSVISAIKEYIEDINTITDNVHMNNLTTTIKTNFKDDIEYIEFIGINGYNALYQYIEKINYDELIVVPEFLNINLLNDTEPDINITIV